MSENNSISWTDLTPEQRDRITMAYLWREIHEAEPTISEAEFCMWLAAGKRPTREPAISPRSLKRLLDWMQKAG